MKKEDVGGAIAAWLLVFLASIPAVLPFLIVDDRFVALRVSNALQLAALFFVGYHWARLLHANPWRFGLLLLLAGLVMVVIVVASGG